MNNADGERSERGFVFSLEAVVALLLFGMLLLTTAQPKPVSIKELLILQQENDLLKVWSAHYPSEGEIIADTRLLFGGTAEVKVDGKVVAGAQGNGKGKAISSEGIIIDDLLQEKKFLVTVYFD